MPLGITVWTAGHNFVHNLEVVLRITSGLKLGLTLNHISGVNFAGVNFLTLVDAQGLACVYSDR